MGKKKNPDKKKRRQNWHSQQDGQNGGDLRRQLAAALRNNKGAEVAEITGIRLKELHTMASAPRPIPAQHREVLEDALKPKDAS